MPFQGIKLVVNEQTLLEICRIPLQPDLVSPEGKFLQPFGISTFHSKFVLYVLLKFFSIGT